MGDANSGVEQGTGRILGCLPFGGERLLGIGAEPHGEGRLARHHDAVLRHERDGVRGWFDRHVVQVVPVVLAGDFVEDAGHLFRHHLHRAVAHGVDAELPAEFVGALCDRVEDVGGNPDGAEEVGPALVGLERPENGGAQAAVNAHFHGADPESEVTFPGNEAEFFERLDLGPYPFLAVVVGVVAGAQAHLHRRPR